MKGRYLDLLNATLTEAALALNVARKTLSTVVNGHSGISPEMALRLAKALDTKAELWLNLQALHDLWIARQKKADEEVVC